MTKSHSQGDKKSHVYRSYKEDYKEGEENCIKEKKSVESKDSPIDSYGTSNNTTDQSTKIEKSKSKYYKEAREFYATRDNPIHKPRGIYLSWKAFRKLYSIYPEHKRGNQRNAFSIWHYTLRIESEKDFEANRDLIIKILNDVKNRPKYDLDWHDQYILQLSRYIRERRWEDDLKVNVDELESNTSTEEFELCFPEHEHLVDQTDQTIL